MTLVVPLVTPLRFLNAMANRRWDANLSASAAALGNLEFLQWSQTCTPPLPFSTWTWISAATYGHLHVLQWLKAQAPDPIWSPLFLSRAAENGHLHVLQWVAAQEAQPCPADYWRDSNLVPTAIRGGHLEIVKWYCQQNVPYYVDNMVYGAATCHRWDILKWLFHTVATSDIPLLTNIQAWTNQRQPHRPECYQLRRVLATEHHLQWDTKITAWLWTVDTVSAEILNFTLCPDLVFLVQTYC